MWRAFEPFRSEPARIVSKLPYSIRVGKLMPCLPCDQNRARAIGKRSSRGVFEDRRLVIGMRSSANVVLPACIAFLTPSFMEIELTRISFEVNVYDVAKLSLFVLHGPRSLRPQNKGRVLNFEVIICLMYTHPNAYTITWASQMLTTHQRHNPGLITSPNGSNGGG